MTGVGLGRGPRPLPITITFKNTCILTESETFYPFRKMLIARKQNGININGVYAD